ncbi:MAG: AAA family ATPase [Paludibacteraceae bacterium]|nr:AAA family ATPase [Paludibacteraceae bacterium]
MGCGDEEIGFVQFHPSYDYTDFVEGLRPIQDENGTVGFGIKDGTFKKFCKKALYDEFKKDIPLPLLKSSTFDDVYKSLLEDVQSGQINKYKTPRGESPLKIKDNRLQYREKSPRTESEENMKLLYEHFLDEEKYDLSDLTKKDYWELIENLTNGKTKTIDYIEYGWTLQVLLDRAKRVLQNPNSEKIHSKEESTQLPSSKNFVFIIDEINRGEISKIFGELFFSIDPSYRGEKGRVQTQYQNMVEDGDAFKNGFYVPENVYIIGTMNDIDRSVESMDFAFRRRFAFVEIEADKNVGMLDDLEWKDEAIERMKRLNEAISNTEGLSYAYHIGASYFLKLKNYDGDFNQLWKFHLEGLLREYLRGMQNVEDSIKKLKSAYDNANPNNGQ